MRVSLYYPWVYLTGGPERIIVELTARSRHQWTILTNRYEPENTFRDLNRVKIIEMPRVSVRRTFRHAAAAGLRIALQKLPLNGSDALVVLSEGLGDFVVARNDRIPTACICLTPLRAAFDTDYQSVYLKMHGNGAWRQAALHGAGGLYRMMTRAAWRRYHRVFALSGEVRRRIRLGGLCPEEKVEVLHPGVDTSRFTPSDTFKSEFLVAGRIMWTKNIELAIDAFKLLLSNRPDLKHFRLTVAGIIDRKSRAYAAGLRERAAGWEQVRFLDFPSDEQILSLYRSAYTILYPPFNEDWGLVPIEAMACGKPVVAVNRGGPSESVVDGETGFLVEPNPKAFADAMERLADSPELARQLGRRARERALEFDWKLYCGRIDDYIDELVEIRNHRH